MVPLKRFAIVSIAALWSLSSSALFAGSLVLNFDSGGFLLQNRVGVDLTGGALLTAFDGEIIQVGYFSGATSNDNNFVGAWIPITGEGSANFVSNTPYDTTVGDDPGQLLGVPINEFLISLIVNTSVQTNLPAAVGTILSIRVYDRSSIAASTSFMTLSSNLWKWKTPTSLTDPNSVIFMSFSDPGLRAENRLGGGGTTSTPAGDVAVPVPLGGGEFALRTNIPVPEPACSLLTLAGCVALFGRRRN